MGAKMRGRFELENEIVQITIGCKMDVVRLLLRKWYGTDTFERLTNEQLEGAIVRLDDAKYKGEI
jgi:hypothetical protein